MLTWDESAQYRRFPVADANFCLMKFSVPDDGSQCEEIMWVNNSAISNGEKFRRVYDPKLEVEGARVSKL